MPQPTNVVVVLLDSLNRHLLGSYGSTEFETPNLDRFAARAARFTRHVTGSLPCMPARHDLLVGSMDFLWRPWGSIEVWEDAITFDLRRAGVTTMLVSDHPHLFETGGENYHCDFEAWEYLRGHESDPWKTVPDPSFVGAPTSAPSRFPMAYDTSRTWFREEGDFPGPRTMATTAAWLDANAGRHDRFLVVVDEFDPHEPFDTPEPWASRYDPDWDGARIIWPPYAKRAVEDGVLTEREARHVRSNYGAKLSMIDHWFGRILDSFDRNGLWADTALVVCTDHGHYLGEHDLFGKPGVPVMEQMGHIPLLVAWPGRPGGDTIDALTTTVDIHATIADVFGVAPAHRTHGRSLVPVLEGVSDTVRDWALCGVWGREVHVTDGRWSYCRAPVDPANRPLSVWSNRWSTMPVHAFPDLRMPRPDKRAWLDAMPGSEVPVIRQPFAPGDTIPFWGYGQFSGSHLWNVVDDPMQVEDRVGEAHEDELVDLLVTALRAVDAPDDQLARLGIA
jgi:arylsulfatase A-like enzyme